MSILPYIILHVMALAYKFKYDFTMCADSANAWDTTIIWDAVARELEKYAVDDVHERHRRATTSHETRPGHLR